VLWCCRRFTPVDTSGLQAFFNSMLVAHVGAGETAGSSQRVLRMINTKRQKEIIRMNYSKQILAVKLNRLRLVVLCEDNIYIYDVRNMRLVHTIESTPKNPRGIPALTLSLRPAPHRHLAGVCALASCDSVEHGQSVGHNFLAYPGDDTKGVVHVFDATNLVRPCAFDDNLRISPSL
jgi:hypothetical protein